MGTITKLNNVLCANISKVDDVLKANASKWDDNTFCPQTPTQTITPTITPTVTQTPSVTPTKTLTPTPTSTPVPPTPTPTTQVANKCEGGHIPKDTVYSYVSCCYPFEYITGTSGPNVDGYDVCYFPYSASTGVTMTYVACEQSGLTSCCEIILGYDANDQLFACNATGGTYYISAQCSVLSCHLSGALAIYTDQYCTVLADDGFYSDFTSYGTQSGGVFTFNGSC